MSAYWPTGEANPASTEPMREFARAWNATPKVVFSHELESVEHGARLVRGDVGEELAKLQQEFDGEIAVGGPRLAAQFIERGLVDEYHMVVHPVVLGAGTPFFPPGVSRIRPPLDRVSRLRLRRHVPGLRGRPMTEAEGGDVPAAITHMTSTAAVGTR